MSSLITYCKTKCAFICFCILINNLNNIESYILGWLYIRWYITVHFHISSLSVFINQKQQPDPPSTIFPEVFYSYKIILYDDFNSFSIRAFNFTCWITNQVTILSKKEEEENNQSIWVVPHPYNKRSTPVVVVIKDHVSWINCGKGVAHINHHLEGFTWAFVQCTERPITLRFADQKSLPESEHHSSTQTREHAAETHRF